MLRRMTDQPRDEDDRIDAAGRWYAELRRDDVTLETWDAFLAWEADPANAEAFRAVERGLGALRPSAAAAPANDTGPDAGAVPGSVTGQDIAAAAPPRGRGGRVAWIAGALAACLVVALGVSVLAAGQLRPAGEIYTTALGEQRTVELADGSRLTLNTNSAVEVAYARDRRLVRQTGGQVYFEVAPSDARPFQVLAGETLTTATGTEFDIWLRPAETTITLLEGGVSVAPAREGWLAPWRGPQVTGEAVPLAPGQQARLAASAAPEIAAVDSTALTSWRSGFVQFTDVTLAEAVRELNRYSAIKLRVTDPELAAERLSGAFPTGDPDGFVETLELYLPIRTVRTADTILIAPPRGG